MSAHASVVDGEREAHRRFGPFEVVAPLARGASGIVFRARDATGREVALKTLPAGDLASLDVLRREVRTLGRIRHPGVVRLLADGVARGIPWYAMELIEGETFAEFLAASRSPDHRREALRILRDVCAPLAFLHAEGIVHRDLKPANVLIRGVDGRPVLVDFGFVARWSTTLAREALQAGGELVGTVDYMAPEQTRGEYVDARADLYALGCMAFEAATGRLPFVGAAHDVIRQHLEAPAPRASAHASDVDPRLDALIARLLEKEPARRLGYATDVAAVLADVTGAPSDPAAPRGGSYLYRPSFVGRAGAIDTIVAHLDAARTGRGGCLLIGGESGSGKTRLAMELTRVASGCGFELVTGECGTTEGGDGGGEVASAPLQPLRALLRFVADRCLHEGSATTARLLGRRAKVLAAYEPALREVPGYAAQPEPAVLPASAERGRVLGDLADLLVVASMDAPLLLLLDDLQWADDMTLALLEVLGPSLARSRVLVLGSFRCEEVGPGLATLLDAAHVARLDLDRLAAPEIGAMVASMLAMQPPPEALVRRLDRESEGNPFFVAEYLRAAVEADLLRRSSAGGWRVDVSGPEATWSLPRSLRALVARRIGALPASVASFLEAAAVLGRDVDGALAATILECGEDAAIDALRELLRRNVLEESASGVRFAHDKLREVAYAGIDEARVVDLHARAAAALEARLPAEGGRPPSWVDLAHHWRMARVPDKAAHYYGLAGESALAMGAYRDAHRVLTQALALDDAAGGRAGKLRRARWQQRLGVAAFGTGDLEGSIRHPSAALAGLGERVPRSAAGWAGLALAELVRVLFPAGVAPAERRSGLYEAAQACGQLATSYFYNADVVPAVANLLRGLERARRAGDAVTVVESCARLAYVSGALGLHGPARALFRRAHGTAVGTGDARGRALALYLDGMYHEVLGDWPGCCELGERAHRILREIGDQPEAETAIAIASHGFFFSGDLVRARDCGLTILRGSEERGHLQHIGWGEYLTARCDVLAGAAAVALPRLERARELLHALPDAIDILISEGWRARALRALGRDDEAFAVAEEIASRTAAGRQPRVAQCVDGYAACAELALRRWWRDPRSAAARLAARQACLELRRFARVFRIARPAADRCAAEAYALAGARARARRLLARSLRRARHFAMPAEEIRTLACIARFAARSPEGARAASVARALCVRAGHAEPLELAGL